METVKELTRYCAVSWRHAGIPQDLWGDATQDVFMQMLGRVPQAEWKNALSKEDNPVKREFWRAIDTAKKRAQRLKKHLSLDGSSTPAGEEAVKLDPADDRIDQLLQERRIDFDTILPHLSPQQAQILRMTVEGHDPNAIAAALNVLPSTVHNEKYRALQRLRLILDGSVA